MKQGFQFNMTRESVNVDQMKVYVIQNENGFINNVNVSVKNQMIGVLVKMIIFGILAREIVNIEYVDR